MVRIARKGDNFTRNRVLFFAFDSMLEENSLIDFYRSQIVKYMWRLRDKGSPLKDAKKAQFYLDQLIEKLEQ